MKQSLKTKLLQIRRFAGRMIRDKAIFYFINGLSVGMLFYFYTESRYENHLFTAVAALVSKDLPDSNRDLEILQRCLHVTHNLENNRSNIFAHIQVEGFKAKYLQPVTFDLMTGKGACGSNTMVMGRLVQEFGFPIRFGQMKVDGQYGGHIILELNYQNEWKVFDPTYNLFYKRPDGQIATFQDIALDWNYYRKQVPADYDMRYRYEGVRYTNWDKIPILLPALQKLLLTVLPQNYVETISLRVIILRKFAFLFYSSLAVFVFLHLLRLYLLRNIRKLRSRQQQLIVHELSLA